MSSMKYARVVAIISLVSSDSPRLLLTDLPSPAQQCVLGSLSTTHLATHHLLEMPYTTWLRKGGRQRSPAYKSPRLWYIL
ncbi:hypothetical protein F5X96DRAFT_613594 [Biscogniauxia mediterranea]|nr:hypothetical protein F5X96DRAFT_613594 [Biscogniauxia mediterranea]